MHFNFMLDLSILKCPRFLVLWAAMTEPRSWPLNCLCSVESAVWHTQTACMHVHAHMSTQMRYAQYALGIALLFVLGRLALRSQWLESNCDSQFVNALTNLFGKTMCRVWSSLSLNNWGLNAIGARATVERSETVALAPSWCWFDIVELIFCLSLLLLTIYKMAISFWCKFCKS